MTSNQIKNGSKKPTKKVSVIIPSYNSYTYLVACVESILENTDLDYELIIADDNSPDKDVKKYLRSLKHKNIKVYLFKKNLGFVGNCNRALKLTKNDVVLLNNDTEVTKGWLRKLQEAAYSDELVASVTPLSNHGAQLSVPNLWEDNSIPKGYTLNEFAKLIEENSLKSYPQITTAVGFCMYIKRSVLDEIGLLDYEKYKPAYGEESDWSMRAFRAGYKNIVDDRTFIYHKGSATYPVFAKKSKIDIQDYRQQHIRLFHKEYPEAERLLRYHDLGKDVKRVILNTQDILIRNEKLKTGKKLILFVNSGNITEKSNGAFIHVMNIIEKLSDKFIFLSLYRSGNKIILNEFTKEGKSKNYAWSIDSRYDPFWFSDKKVERIFVNILNDFNVDIVHFQTPQNFPLSLFYLAKKEGKGVIFSIHDFLLYCRNYLLVTKNKNGQNVFCDFEKDQEKCAKCLTHFFPANNHWYGYPKDRRDYIKKYILPNIDKVITPSSYMANEIRNLFPEEVKHLDIQVIEHGLKKLKTRKKLNVKSKDSKLNIAYLGSFSPEKGSTIFTDFVIKNKKKYNYFVFGKVGDTISYQRIKNYCHFSGKYKQEDIPKLLKNIDIGLSLSICNESYSYTLSEFWKLKIPVIGINRGAVGQRISEQGFPELLLSRNNPIRDLEVTLQNINNDRSKLKLYQKSIPVIKGVDENMKDYEKLYRSFKKDSGSFKLKVSDYLIDALLLGSKTKIEEDIEVMPKVTWANKIYYILKRLHLDGIFKPFYRHLKKIFNEYKS